MNRRDFVHLTTAAALSFAADTSASALSATKRSSPLIDTNVSLGRWLFRRLPLDQTSRFVRKLRNAGVTQAWAASFAAAFHQNPAPFNSWLAAECRQRGRGLLVPFGTVNLRLPDWERELDRCVAELKMRGLRLFPGFHGYSLRDDVFAELLARAAERNLVIQIAAALEDERTQPVTRPVPNLNATPLLAQMKQQPNVRVELLNWHRAVKPDFVKHLAQLGVSFDIATLENVGGVGILIGEISAERVMFGSHAPFFYLEAALLKLDESELRDVDAAAVRQFNAHRWLA